jgi:outer membrane protein assembly factor BamD
MRTLRTIILALALAVSVGGSTGVLAQEAKQKTKQEASKAKLTKEQRRAAREKRITERATAATQVKVREGKHPSYNRLIKSTSYALMYTEGLRYFNMTKRGKDYNSLANMRRAQTLFDLAVRSQAFSGTPQDDSLYFYYGRSYFLSRDFVTSQEIFDQFRRRYTMSPFIEEAEYNFSAGFYFLSPDARRDQSVTVRAIAQITEFLGRYPDTKYKEISEQRLDELRRKLYSKSFENARLYYTVGQYKAAVRALGNAIDEYPQSPYREELMYLATRSAWLLAKNSIQSMMTDRYLAMMDNYYNLISEYPETRYLREVEEMRDEAQAYIETHTSESSETTTTDNNGSN